MYNCGRRIKSNYVRERFIADLHAADSLLNIAFSLNAVSTLKLCKKALSHLQEIFLRCWSYEPKDRSSFVELKAQLEKLPKLHRNPSYPVKSGSMSRSHESLVWSFLQRKVQCRHLHCDELSLEVPQVARRCHLLHSIGKEACAHDKKRMIYIPQIGCIPFPSLQTATSNHSDAFTLYIEITLNFINYCFMCISSHTSPISFLYRAKRSWTIDRPSQTHLQTNKHTEQCFILLHTVLYFRFTPCKLGRWLKRKDARVPNLVRIRVHILRTVTTELSFPGFRSSTQRRPNAFLLRRRFRFLFYWFHHRPTAELLLQRSSKLWSDTLYCFFFFESKWKWISVNF